MLAEGFAAREGILDYELEDGTSWREYVPAATLEASARSLVGLPVTMEHPPEDVTPDNYDRYAVGTVTDAMWDPEERAIRATISVMRRDVLDAIRGGKQELSPGYEADVEDAPGECEFGQYDAVQVARNYNHLAIVDEARGGPTVRARFDAAGHIIRERGPTMNPQLIAIALALGIRRDGVATDDHATELILRRIDSMKEEMRDEEEKNDEEGVEKMDAETVKRLESENAELKKMLDAMLKKQESAGVKQMADAYGEEMRPGDRADDVIRRIAKRITGHRVDSAHVARGIVFRDVQLRRRLAQLRTDGRAAWHQAAQRADSARPDHDPFGGGYGPSDVIDAGP